MHTTVEKFGVCKMFEYFKVSYSHQGFIYLIKNTVKM